MEEVHLSRVDTRTAGPNMRQTSEGQIILIPEKVQTEPPTPQEGEWIHLADGITVGTGHIIPQKITHHFTL